jgi:choline dehydrogenase-like flavoprotein
MERSPDIVIVGSGMGGATLAAGLAPSGAPIVTLEHGRHIPKDAPARDPNRIVRSSALRSPETWLNEKGEPFEPGNYYHVGGNSKLYGAVLIRFRAEDFAEMEHFGGVSPAWPLPDETPAPFYDAALHRFHDAFRQRVVARKQRAVDVAHDGRVPSHQCGTARSGDDPAASVLDPECRAWDHPNVFVTDAVALPTSAAVNPALTVAAMALRTTSTIGRELGVRAEEVA